MKNRYYIRIACIITVFTAIFLGISQYAYADTNQMLIKKDKVIVFRGEGQTGGWVFSMDGKSKQPCSEIGGGASVITYFNKYALLYEWEGHQTDTVALFDTDTLKCVWATGGNCLVYSGDDKNLYMQISGERNTSYVKVTADGKISTLDKLDSKVKLNQSEYDNLNGNDGISIKELSAINPSKADYIITDSKYNKKYDNISALNCFLNDSNYMYIIENSSEYGAPPLSYFIKINRKSGLQTKTPLFISETSSLQFYNNKLMFYGQMYSCTKEVDSMYPAVFIIDKDGKNIKPLYNGDGIPSDTNNIFSEEVNKSYKAGDKISVPEYSKVRSNGDFVAITPNDKIYTNEGMLFQKGTTNIAFLKMKNSTTRIISFKEGSNTGTLIKDGLPYNIFSSLVHKKYILFRDKDQHSFLLDMDTSHVNEISAYSANFIDENNLLPSQYGIIDERIFTVNASQSNVYLYDFTQNKKLLIAKNSTISGITFRNNSFYYIENNYSQSRQNYFLCKVNLANGLNHPPVYLLASSGRCDNFAITNKFIILYNEKALNLFSLNDSKCILHISGPVDYTLSKDNKLYYLSYNNNILAVGMFDMSNATQKEIYSSSLELKDYNLGSNGASISIEDNNTIKINLFGEKTLHYSLDLKALTLKSIS